MDTIYIGISTRKYLQMILLILVFISMSIRDVIYANYFRGLITFIFFGLILLIVSIQLIDGKARIILDEEGITDNSLRVGKILWADIRSAYIRTIVGQEFLVLEFYSEEKYLAKMPLFVQVTTLGNWILGFGRLTINLSSVEADTEEVLRIVQERSGH